MSFYGFPLAQQLLQTREWKGMLGTVFGSNYAYFLGANSGSINLYNGRYSSTTSTFIQEYSRSGLFYHGTNADIVLVFDRSNILNPSTLPYWTNDQYSFWSANPTIASQITQGTLKRRTWQWHCVTTPSISSNTISYKPVTPTGNINSGYTFVPSTTQTVTITTLFTTTSSTFQPTATMTQQNSFSWSAPDNTGFLVSEVSNVDADWDATLHVIAMADVGYSVIAKNYFSSPAGAKLALITMPSPDNNVIAIYNTAVGPTIPSPNCCGSKPAGSCSLGNYPCMDDPTVQNIVPTQHYFNANFGSFYFQVTISTSTVDFFLNDLNPANNYDLYLTTVKQKTILPTDTTQGFVFVRLTGLTPGVYTVCIQISSNSVCQSIKPSLSSINSGSIFISSFYTLIVSIIIFLF